MHRSARETGTAQPTYSSTERASVAEAWRGVRRLLVARLDNIGDVVMLGPALFCLKEALPQAEITLLASPAGAQAAPLLPWIDRVIEHRALWQELDAAAPPDAARQHALIQQLQANAFDAVLIFTGFAQSPHAPAYASYLAGIPLRAGLSKEFGGAVLTHWVKPPPDEVHQVERNLFLLQALGFEAEQRDLRVEVPQPVQRAADRLLSTAGIHPGQPFVVLAPGASCAARRYPLARMATVARGLWAETGLTVVLAGSEGEREQLAALAAGTDGACVSLAGQTSIPELAAVMRRAALVICNNSGPMHLADALRRPMVVLFSGTELQSQWRPRSAAATLLNRPVGCSPCYAFTCPYNLECLDLPPEQVVAEARRLLAQAPLQPQTALGADYEQIYLSSGH